MRQCNICILIHDKQPNLEILQDFLKILEELDANPKILYTINITGNDIDISKSIPNNLEHRVIKYNKGIINDISEDYDTDLPIYYIESHYDLTKLGKIIHRELEDKPIYINETFDKYSYYKLFYLPYYLVKNDTEIDIVKLDELESQQILDNLIITNSMTRDQFVKYSNYITNNIISLFCETLKNDNKIVNLNIADYFNENISKSNRWLINYFFGITYYNLDNYKKAKEYFKNCISIYSSKKEAVYFLAKIDLLNERYNNCKNIINNFKDECDLNMFTNNEICNFHYEYLNILLNLKINDNYQGLNIANKLINSEHCPKQYRRIILHYIDKLQECKNSNNVDNRELISKITKFTSLNYDNLTNYKIVNDDITMNIKKNDKNIEIISGETTKLIDYSDNEIFSCVCHKDNKLLIVNSISPLIINSIKDSKIIKLLEYKTDKYLQNYRFISKLVPYKNAYIGLLAFRDGYCNFKDNLYKILVLDRNSLKPINVSSLFKISLNYVRDIFIVDDYLLLLGRNTHTFISLCDFYMDENLDIDYAPEISLEKIENVGININCVDHIIDKQQYKNYNINMGDSKYDIIIDFNTNTITNCKSRFCQLINRFVYFPTKDNIQEKTDTISFYSSKTDVLLRSFLDNKSVSINEDYKKAKYLIITTFDLENMSYKELSNIINNKTLIITLLEEEEVNNTVNIKYKTNQYLNKLFLFNIVKNEDYMEFIYEKIIQDDQYKMRKEYFDVDIKNIYNHTNLFELVIEFIDCEESMDKKLDILETSNDYKIELINKLHRKTENTCIIEVLKYILLHNQDIHIFSENEEIDELIYKLNILGNFFVLDNIDTENYIGTKNIIILNNYDNFKNWQHLYNKDTLIYVINHNKIIYSSLTNS